MSMLCKFKSLNAPLNNSRENVPVVLLVLPVVLPVDLPVLHVVLPVLPVLLHVLPGVGPQLVP